ncbi:hypothetical protein EX30DRAFT_399121 [Ascodesmis nigricans]|uniref:ferric-chelate reductase (NADPH) n=1 Tax=Ascodesmis nigricans TaxID=341454 RepID=A0A4V3SHL4_9PEZI|nr:hypothetical protein EX30DRAFT_399121 [Ascodesmis nigricans]
MPDTFIPNLNILNKELYNTNDIQVQFYQLRLKWPWRRGNWHALGWIFFTMGFIIIYGLLNHHDARLDRKRLKIARENRRRRGTDQPRLKFPEHTLYDRASTHMRSFAYKRLRRIPSVSIGMWTLVFAGFLFPMLYVFTQHPYYAREIWMGPPPLAGRSGMMAIAMLPFIIALGMKVNLVSLITGVGHEKLNVLHRWLAVLFGILSLIHAIPYVVEPVKRGGWQLAKEKFMSHPTYWNGVGAMACLFWLCVASMPFIRAWCYEIFVHLHIAAGLGFVGLLFWHCNNMLTSWHYLYATVVIWGGCLLHRLFFRTNLLRAIKGEQCHVKLLTDEGVQLTIPTTMRWTAGQHVFIRIPSISLLDNHPFTVASYPERPEGEVNDLVIVFKPHSGFTRRVYDLARIDPDRTFTAYLDGPYGGLARKLESFETVVMISGGSGITPVIGHLSELAQKIRNKEAVTRDVRIIWTVKHFESLEWFKDTISKIARTMPRNSLLVQYFVTEETPVPLPAYPISAIRDWPSSPCIGGPAPKTPSTPFYPKASAFPSQARLSQVIPDEHEYELQVLRMAKELGHPEPAVMKPASGSASGGVEGHGHALGLGPFSDDNATTSPSSTTYQKILPPIGDEVLLEFGRPPLREALREWSGGFGKRACIYVCGPAGMKVDVANAAAEMQDDIWISELREEVYLHTETFGW